MRRPRCRASAIVLTSGALAGAPAPTPAAAQSAFDLEDVAVLSGCWAGWTGSVQLHEQWTGGEGGAMLGSTRYLREGVLVDWEFGRIVEEADGVTFWPYPRGVSSERGFPLVRADSALVFENFEHDFPVRIIYELDGRAPDGAERLHVRIEGRDGAGPEWAVERVPCPPQAR